MPRKKKKDVESDELKINEKYASELERRKRREELHRARSLGIDLDDNEPESESESSESEDDNARLLTKKIDRQIAQTIEAIKRKDARLYDKNTRFFEAEEADEPGDDGAGDGTGDSDAEAEEDDDSGSDASSGDEPVAGWDAGEENGTSGPLTIKDYVRKEIMEKGTLEESSASEDEQAENAGEENRPNQHLYDDEQRNLKRDVLDAKDDEPGGYGESEDEFFVVKEKTAEEEGREEREFDQFVADRNRNLGKARGEEYLLHNYLERESLDQKERFLRDFVLNNGWLDRNQAVPDDAVYSIEVDRSGIEDEEDFIDKQDQVERAHNFRFEESQGTEIISYSRATEDSVRRKDEKRREKREKKKLKKEQEKQEKLEEVKRLKNLKKADIREQLDMLRATSGGVSFDDFDLDEDFDPDKFSQQMAAKFGDDYYERQDEELKHPFANEAGDLGTGAAGDAEMGDEASAEAADTDKLRGMVDDYYNIGVDHLAPKELKFKYRQVDPDTHGLTIEQILSQEDKELNRMAPLKRLAPYRKKKDRRVLGNKRPSDTDKSGNGAKVRRTERKPSHAATKGNVDRKSKKEDRPKEEGRPKKDAKPAKGDKKGRKGGAKVSAERMKLYRS